MLAFTPTGKSKSGTADEPGWQYTCPGKKEAFFFLNAVNLLESDLHWGRSNVQGLIKFMLINLLKVFYNSHYSVNTAGE
ncbi:hypothetical protein SCFA_110005 [anaerobic digester metagenome]|uniref:Uncharacterized protein n=1 Tax=anaerobic digester metagenome TaxID=1263854 RepID=A0A485LU20_9ZZZZ